MHDVLFDASRLISRTERTAPTGVDRVCLAYAEWLIALDDVRMIPVRSRKDRLVFIDPVWFAECVQGLRKRWTNGAKRGPIGTEERHLLEALYGHSVGTSVMSSPPTSAQTKNPHRLRVWKQFFRSRTMPDLPPSRHYFNVGHTSLNTPEILLSLKARNIQSVVLLHDLIPITHPEFCRPGDGTKHRRRVLTALQHSSRILVNSGYTASELGSFAQKEGIVPPPIDAVHLGLEPVFVAQIHAPPPRPYFVHIGTIEARKNLAFLLTIWRRLHERMGDAAPQLVLIGRYGWENEAVLDHLERSPNLRGLVHQAADLPDASLATLMNNAQAVLAPSSVEGFDLPTVEASALGVPLIASDIPVHRELVPHAELIDPLDGLGWLAALERATLNRPIAPAYTPPTWPKHFEDVARHVGLSGA